ncbi:MAG: hypothetical protein IT481_08705 [Gammaproteobacteria bacterium]|nr:hypothetical protein [Gammaproteobacteria bacterium]
MLALTVWQPWASLIMVGAKPYEFRSRSYLAYRPLRPEVGERVVIHAGARRIKPAEVEDLLARLESTEDATGLIADRARELLLRLRQARKYQGLPLAAGLGTVALGKPRNAGEIFRGRDERGLPQDSDRGDFNSAWPVRSIEPFDAPIPAKGAQGFWRWPHAVTKRAA